MPAFSPTCDRRRYLNHKPRGEGGSHAMTVNHAHMLAVHKKSLSDTLIMIRATCAPLAVTAVRVSFTDPLAADAEDFRACRLLAHRIPPPDEQFALLRDHRGACWQEAIWNAILVATTGHSSLQRWMGRARWPFPSKSIGTDCNCARNVFICSMYSLASRVCNLTGCWELYCEDSRDL
jgi:hypothetical protein